MQGRCGVAVPWAWRAGARQVRHPPVLYLAVGDSITSGPTLSPVSLLCLDNTHTHTHSPESVSHAMGRVLKTLRVARSCAS